MLYNVKVRIKTDTLDENNNFAILLFSEEIGRISRIISVKY